MFDKDNTLTAPYDNTSIHPKAQEGFASALEVFGHDRVAILSNSAGTLDDVDYEDAAAIEQNLGIRVIRHDEKKPGGCFEVLQHFGLVGDDASDNYDKNTDGTSFKAMQLDSLAAKVCVMGDRLLTDVVFGNLHGMLTVHTMPVCTGKENRKDNVPAKIVRRLENGFLYRTPMGRRLGTKPPNHAHWQGQERLKREED